jgi:predicted nucleic acid-binding protein
VEGTREVSNPPVVLDTNIFYDAGFVRWLKDYRRDKKAPPIVYCELAVKFIAGDGDTSKLDRLLRGAGVDVSRMLMFHGRQAAEFAQGARDWKDHWRDYMIAAHAANPPTYLVTFNIKDFGCLSGRAVTPPDFQEGIRSGRIH